ncbi:MAG: hypothetical protein HZC51_04380 [Nitrospirae bacterium]|nr:hypothetical protein [Nitrospirota bacterium]
MGEVFLTVVSGVVVFVLGQIVIKFFIEPIHEQRKAIGVACDTLIFYSGYYACPKSVFNDPDREEAMRKTRELSTLLISQTHLIPWYPFFENIRIVKKKSVIISAARDIIGLTSDMYDENNGCAHSRSRINEIERKLNIIISDKSLSTAENK